MLKAKEREQKRDKERKGGREDVNRERREGGKWRREARKLR